MLVAHDVMGHETAAVQSPAAPDDRAAYAAQQAMINNVLHAQRAMAWMMEEHFVALLQASTAQVQAAYRDVAAAQVRAALAEARAAAAEARAARAESIAALLRQELGRG